jgi:hypothetical protein
VPEGRVMVTKKTRMFFTILLGIITGLASLIYILINVIPVLQQKHEPLLSPPELMSRSDTVKLPLPKPEINTLNDTVPPKKFKNTTSTQYTLHKIYYEVILVIPSIMSDPEIFVDDERAEIVEQNLTVIKIRVMQKEGNHRITVKKGDKCITKEQSIRRNNLILKFLKEEINQCKNAYSAVIF